MARIKGLGERLTDAVSAATKRNYERMKAKKKEAAKSEAQKEAETNARIAPVGKVRIKKRPKNMKAGTLK